jgi:hypothetical protein
MNVCLGPNCGKPCKQKYCSRLCNNRAWKKSKKFLKRKCIICKEPCRNKYCSQDCANSKKKEYKEICLTCGKEFTYNKISYKLRGGMKYCSPKCASSTYYFDEDFFTSSANVETAYEILGFVFGYGVIDDYSRFQIVINADKQLLQNFVAMTKTSYPIKEIPIRGSNDKKYRLIFRSQKILNYLYDVGFTHSLVKHEFPCILDEYKKYFIKGFLNSPNCCVYEKENYNLVVILTKSYHIFRTIADFTNGDIITKNLQYCCVFKDYDKFYTKNMLQINNLSHSNVPFQPYI